MDKVLQKSYIKETKNMKLKYTLNRKKILNNKDLMEMIQACDKGCKGMKGAIVELGKIQHGLLGYLFYWILTRFTTRKITDEYVEYNFYLLL